jgi:error-prone DNA polymerase
MKPLDPPKPRKPRRLRAPLEPGLPEVNGEDDDPRSALYKLRRRETIRTLCRDHYGTTGRIENRQPAKPADQSGARENEVSEPACYAELHCLSNFSFQRGASSARELFERAKKLGYSALAITDECSLAGIVRALEVAEETKIPLIVGTEVELDDGPKLVLLARNHDGYSDICRLITTGRRRSPKGEYQLVCADAEALGDGVLVLWTPTERSRANAPQKNKTSKPSRRKPSPSRGGLGGDGVPDNAHATWLKQHFHNRIWLAAELHRGPDDTARLEALRTLAARHEIPLVAAGDVHMHIRKRRALQDVMTAIRLNRTVAEAGAALFPNGERHLRRLTDLARIYPADLLAETQRIASLCTFDLRKLNYQYPHELVPEGATSIDHLRELTFDGARTKWPDGIPESVHAQLDKELALIEYKEYESFFLTVHDIVRWARAQSPPILCQGRGSSANSAVCYALGVTVVAPDKSKLLFERFISKERDEPPDIDVDFEHERREEVIQYVFGKYGRGRAALAATVISYRGRSAVRDVGRALGLPEDQLDRLTSMFSRVRSGSSLPDWLAERGFDPSSRVLHRLFALASDIYGFPRHLSQHVGGFVISEQPLHHLVPVENAAMPDRTIIQWDKDDLEEMKLLKVDCLALGMLTCLHKCFDLLHEHGLWTRPYRGARPTLDDVPLHDDENVYGMISHADTIGVFQIESRAQMSMLPRLKPVTYYDLVVEIAIVRPGPIQGQMVHPYLRRRKGHEEVEYPLSRIERENGVTRPAVKDVLERTLGVPIFQEQVMKLIEVVAGFTPGQADELRRAMAAWKRRGGLERFHDRIRDGMLKRGYSLEYFERVFEQIKGFGEYGFPESHSASFAVLAYASSWLKRYHPAAFTCALLNAQPMGFYQPSQLVQDAQRHGVAVRPADVVASEWNCTLEFEPMGDFVDAHGATTRLDDVALRLGLREIRGLSENLATRLVAARNEAPFADVADMTRRARVSASERARLADAGALASLSGHRYRARWDSAGAELPTPVFARATIREQPVDLRQPSLREEVMTDYATQGLSLEHHPLSLVRAELSKRRVSLAKAANDPERNGQRMRCAGLVTVRQHPGTAKGVTFVTIEDESGHVNVVVWRALAERQHRVLLESRVMGVDGVLQVSEGVHHLIADRLHDYSALLPELSFASRDFH